MKQRIYQIDAFTDRLFGGNPAAVCVLDSWLEDDLMQKIAAENNLAETAFLVHDGDRYHLRWFTPAVEVDLCGHATLASAFVLFQYYEAPGDRIEFYSPRSGNLSVSRNAKGLLTLDFPADRLSEANAHQDLVGAMGRQPEKILKGKTDYLFVYASEADVAGLKPDMAVLGKADGRGIIATAPGNEVDFVSRFFAPQSGIDEDPVTGSAHTSLAPYWGEVLDKKSMKARQISARGGDLQCTLQGDRVQISGHAVPYLEGEIQLP